jgi:hypothetical protein
VAHILANRAIILTNDNDFSPPHESQSDLLALGQKLAELNRALASAEQHADGRNASVRSLKKQIAQVTEQMGTLGQITGLTNATLGTEAYMN